MTKKKKKLSQFTDINILLVSDQAIVSNLPKLVQELKRIFSLTVNTRKTEAMWLRAWGNKTDAP